MRTPRDATGPEGDGEHSYGNPDAPVTIVEFGDFECPYCRSAAPILRALVDTSDGAVRLVFRHFPLFEVHPHALTSALAAEAAAAGGLFWEMHDLLLTHQGHLADDDLRGYAEELGLAGASVVGDAVQTFGDRVEADYLAGLARGVAGTPTVFVDGERYAGKLSPDALRAAVADQLSGADGRAPGPRG